jgi:Mg-chelatase subunit ChlD
MAITKNTSFDSSESTGMDFESENEALPLTTKISPRNDVIGLKAPQKSTDFCVTVSAKELPEDDVLARAPVDLEVVMDISGSMSGRKLDLCKKTLSVLLRELSSKDRFGLVTFGDEANVEIPIRNLTKAHKESALAKIKALTTTGCTNISGGISLAAQELQSIKAPHEVRTVFLLTDGNANRGISSKEGIVQLTRSCLGANAERREIAIHCFGYGSDHDSDMLKEISRATEGGSYYFVDSDVDVSSSFGDALGGVLSVVAQSANVKIGIHPNAAALGVSIVKVKHDKARQESDGSFTVPLGDFYSEESRDIIIETTLPNVANGGKIPLIQCQTSYLDTINKKLVYDGVIDGEIERPDNNIQSITNTHVALQCIRIKAASIIASSKEFADTNEIEKARSLINAYIAEVENEAKSLELSTDPLILQIISELNEIMKGLQSQHHYRMSGKMIMTSKGEQYCRQRCFESSEASFSAYRTSKKSATAMRMKKHFQG